MFCSQCGFKNEDDAKFCASCGYCLKLAEVASEEEVSAEEPFAEEPAVEAASAEEPLVEEAPTAYEEAPAKLEEPLFAPAPMSSGSATKPAYSPEPKRQIKPPALIGAATAVVLVLVLGVGTFAGIMPWSGKGSVDDLDGKHGVVINSKGEEVHSLTRPSMVTIHADKSTTTMGSPALVEYANGTKGSSSQDQGGQKKADQKQGAQKDEGQQNGQQGGAQKGADGVFNKGHAPADQSTELVVVGKSVNGNTAVKNPYGVVKTVEPKSNFDNVANLEAFKYVLNSDSLAQALKNDRFAVEEGYDREFFDLYEMNRYGMKASFVTTDSAMHTYHLYFQHLLKNTEKGALSDKLASACKDLLTASNEQYAALVGTDWEEASKRDLVFFSVACLLLGEDASVPDDMGDVVRSEYNKAMDASGISVCELTGENLDYSQFKPRGYYEGDPQLESYFRAMNWVGQLHFLQSNESLDRSALLMTLAMDGGTNGTPNEDWAQVYEVTSFFAGQADDNGYYEYFPLIQSAYGDDLSMSALVSNTDAWDEFHKLTAKMAAPAINSVVLGHERAEDTTLEDMKGYRFMGQRFTLDSSIFQQLIYPNVERNLPSALDVPAALGSEEATAALKEEGKTDFKGYSEKMESTREALSQTDGSVWGASLYSQWLYTLNPLLVSKGEGYPQFMQSSKWDRKNLQTYLGSYTELKHDTVLYSKQVAAEMGGGPIDFDDRGYVEPEPELYARLSQLATATAEGLEGFGMLNSEDKENLELLVTISDRLKSISEKELAGEEVSSDDYDFIRDYGGTLEHFWKAVNPNAGGGTTRSMYSPAAVVVDVATDGENGTCLELATGKIDEIYVLVEIAGELHLCKGGVFSYYEFEQPISNRLSDSQWREMLGVTAGATPSDSIPARPAWARSFVRER